MSWGDTMPGRIAKFILAGALAGGAVAADAESAGPVATVEIPGNPLDNFDIGTIDADAGRYYLADRSNSAVDIFDTRTKAFLSRVTGFVGVRNGPNGRPAGNISGPNGVAFDPTLKQLWVGDGDSTVKVIDVASTPAKIIASVPTGGQRRADELTVDPQDGLVLVGNNAEKPTYVTLISTKPDHAIVAKIEMPDATDGIDQPTWMAETGMFYASVPVWKEEKNHGGLAVIDPRSRQMVKLIPIDNCMPAGSAHGPGTLILVGCSAGSATRTPGMEPVTILLDARTEMIVKRITGIGGADEVWYDPGKQRYYTASRDQPGGPVLGNIEVESNTLLQRIPTGTNAHSVAADPTTGLVWVPLTAPNSACPHGCIGVYETK
jgi:DNA-binding beta-propeller fold protein YncE